MSVAEHLLASSEELDDETQANEDVLVFNQLQESVADHDAALRGIHNDECLREMVSDLNIVASTMESASLAELALMQIAANLAGMNAGYSAESLYPSLESSEGTRVSTESTKDVIDSLWERIYRAIKALIKGFIAFWKTVFDAVDRLRRANTRMKVRAGATVGRNPTVSTVTLRREVDKLSLRGVPPSSGPEIVRNMTEARHQLEVILGNYISNVTDAGEALKTALGNTRVGPEDYLEGVVTAANRLQMTRIASMLSAKAYRDVRFRANEVLVAPPLPGNKSLFVRTGGDGPKSDDLFVRAQAARSQGIQLAYSDARDFPAHSDYPIQTMSAKDVQALATVMDQILSVISDFVKGSTKDKLSRLHSSLLDTSASAKNTLYSGAVATTDSRYYEAALRFNTAFAGWSGNPHDALVTHLLSVCRAALVLGNKSLLAHG